MTQHLVRLPDQFRPARDTPIAATPTCCCCCCCCIATLITASVVLPMRVELMSHAPDGQRVEPGRVGGSKVVAGIAPVLSFAMGIALGIAFKELLAFSIVFPVVLVALLALAFAPFGKGVSSIPTTIVFFLAFAAEFVVGLFGILATAGILYLGFAIVVSALTIKQHRAMLRRVGAGRPDDFFGAPADQPRPANRLPPLPKPPSSDE